MKLTSEETEKDLHIAIQVQLEFLRCASTFISLPKNKPTAWANPKLFFNTQCSY